MIKYNNSNINDWNFGDDNIIKVYKHGAVVFYKFDSESQSFKVCYAVVEDISQYSDREFEDVYDKATDKWYKLNNLNRYEEYGVYASGRNITYYNGKLTVDEGYEYEWNGSSWVNLGEVSGSSKTSDFKIGDIDIPITSDASLITDGMYGIILPVSLSSQTTNATALMGSSNSNTLSNLSSHTMSSVISENDIIDYAAWKFHGTTTANTFYVENVATKKYFGYSNVSSSNSLPLVDESSKVPTVFSAFTKNNVTAFGICKGNTPNQYYAINNLYGTNNRYNWFNPLSQAGDLNNSFMIYKLKDTSYDYPKYYEEKSEPLDNLNFNTMEDAVDYAYNNCVYDGMKAVIAGDRYYFDSNDENGWVKILEYYKFEDVTPNAASGWTISGSSTYNPDSSYYDDFDLQTTSTSFSYKIAKVTIYGYDHFTYYLRSYHPYTASYGYVMATNVDEVSTPPSTMSYNSSSAITHTYNFMKSPKSAVNLSNYRRITYNNLDKTVEHTFYVYFYGRTYSSYGGNATILIPKDQTNENWEQVTFSASSNVASSTKNLYIDGNNSTSGGTDRFYYRWIIGLPSGSHTSYTNYSNYNYCPNVTSSTFTSVAGEQRQVNFTYDNTTNKNLYMRLVDSNGNVLSPSDTVYYYIYRYNSCNVSSLTSTSLPSSQTLKVGGSFYFGNSSNRHYIYGYTAPATGVTYYVDNYSTTFDLVYTALTREAVTITYTTYDPSDVETPAFNTDITWPYNGGTTSSTTLTSYAVPYTYSYKVSQTSDKFSALTYTYTAGQASRTINFTLYPNNREFATVAAMEAYQYVWEGMNATVGTTKYEYKNGEWVEKRGSLPDVPFTINYNAKQYNSSTKTLLKTDGQLANVDAVITAGTPTVHNGYITIASGTRAVISGYQNYFNRTSSSPNLTIISKQRTDGNNGHMFANRSSGYYNWMYRCYSNKLTLHGTSEQGSVAVTTQPVIESVRINSSRFATYNNYTNNTSSTYSNFNYGNTNSVATALFAGYSDSTLEWFVGDFYWVYMCQGTLTDEQVQQVIDYNENL